MEWLVFIGMVVLFTGMSILQVLDVVAEAWGHYDMIGLGRGCLGMGWLCCDFRADDA